MKKLLSLLSLLTIIGTAMPTVIAASPYKKIIKQII
ncbi:lipoprotein [Spiroplasma endosymbiont of Polydrusus cervinus]